MAGIVLAYHPPSSHKDGSTRFIHLRAEDGDAAAHYPDSGLVMVDGAFWDDFFEQNLSWDDFGTIISGI